MSTISSGFGAHTHTEHPYYLSSEQRARTDRRANAIEETGNHNRQVLKGQKKGKVVVAPDLRDFGFTVNLAEGTFEAPTSVCAIKNLLTKLQDIKPGVTPPLYFSKYISARQLDLLHLGVGEHAPHLRPGAPGLTEGTLDDQKLIHVVWQFPTPKSGDLHPEEAKISDGRLVAVWPTSYEHGAEEAIKEFKKFTSRVVDRLGGNMYALEQRFNKRILGGLAHRYRSYSRGMKEGMSLPRFNGRIGANLLLTSLPLSAVLYALFYAVQYSITSYENEHHHHHHHHHPGYGNNGNNSSVGIVA